jgi:hypothetical protein
VELQNGGAHPTATNLDKFENRTRPVSDELGHFAVLVPQSSAAGTWRIDSNVWDVLAPSSCKFAIAPPSVPVNDWTLWQTRDLDFAETDENRQKAIRTDIANVLAAFQKREDG